MAKKNLKHDRSVDRPQGRLRSAATSAKSAPSPGVANTYWLAWCFPVWQGVMLALIFASQLIPCDSVSVLRGHALPQVALWLLLFATAPLMLWASSIRRVARAQGKNTSIPDAIIGATEEPIWRFKYLSATLVLLMLLLLWMAANLIYHAGAINTRAAINVFWQWVVAILIWGGLGLVLQTNYQRRCVLLMMVLVATASSLHGLYQYSISMPADRAEYAANPDSVLERAGLSAPEGSIQRVQFENRLNSTEPIASFALTNSLATFLAPWFIFSLAQSLRCLQGMWRGGANPWKLLIAWSTIIVLIGTVLLLTKSRAAFVGTMAGLGIYFVFEASSWLRSGTSAKRWGALAVASTLGISAVLAVVIFWWQTDRLVVTEAFKSLGYRLQYWQATWEMVGDHLVWGIGLGSFQSIYPAYQLPDASETIADPHNFVLEVMAASGLPGILLFCAAIVGVLLVSRKARSRSTRALQESCSENSISPEVFGRPALQLLIAGLLAGVPMAWMLGIPFLVIPETWPYILAAPVLAMLVWLLQEWLSEDDSKSDNVLGLVGRAGGVSDSLLLSCLVSIGVCLIATGGFLAPGVTNGCWILLSFLLFPIRVNHSTSNNVASEMVGGSVWLGKSNSPSIPVLLFSLAGWVLVGLFLWQAWNPALKVETALGSMNSVPREQASAILAASMQADRWDPRPAEAAFGLAASQKRGLPARENDPVLESLDAWLSRDRANPFAKKQGGDWCIIVDDNQLNPTWVGKSKALYQQAVSDYPTRAEWWVQLAVLEWVTGNETEALNAVNQAIELDLQMPHLDRKLSVMKVMVPRGGELLPEGIRQRSVGQNVADGSSDGIQSGYLAEPVASFLRSFLTSKSSSISSSSRP